VLAKLKASGVPVVVVLVSGRPLDISAQLPDWDALLAAWLPGTEGHGVADVLFGDYPPTGKLPMTWMQSATQEPINAGDGQTPLFPQGFGLTYPDRQDAGQVIGAAYYSGQSGTQLERCTDYLCGQNVGWITGGDQLYYDNVDFGSVDTAPTRISSRVASGSAATGAIDYRLDSGTGPVIATASITNTGGWQNWTTITSPISGTVTGKHRLYLTFRSPTTQDFVNINWFQFGR